MATQADLGTSPDSSEAHDPTQASTGRGAAAAYEGLGWRAFPLTGGRKTPRRGVDWKGQDYQPADFHGADNVGVVLGARSGGLVDLDLDMHEARLLAGELLPEWPGFGRAGARGSHRLARCPDAPEGAKSNHKFGFDGRAAAAARQLLQLEDGEKAVVLELRTGPAAYTMFPPSVHPTAERLAWIESPVRLPVVPWENLQVTARCLALCAVVLRLYPRQAGQRDDASMALAGALLRAGLDAERVDLWTTTVARLAHDEEWQARGKAQATAERIAAGEPATGLTRLCELLGCETARNTLAKWTGLGDEDAVAPQGAIVLNRPATHEVVGDLEQVLLARGNTYRRGAELVRLRQLEEPSQEVDASGGRAIYRREGVVEIAEASREWLVMEVSRSGVELGILSSNFRRVPAKECAHDLGLLRAIATDTAFPVLRGISTTPTLDRSEPGYDKTTKLLLAFQPGSFPPVPMKPSKDDAASALKRLERPLRMFPFVDDADRSVAVAAMLLSVVRAELGPCPLHGFSAPAPGSGKTLLASMAGLVGTGVEPSAITYTPDADEMEKRLSALLRAGDQVVLVDNVAHPMQGPFLCSMFTSDEVQARLLGRSERMLLPSRVTVLATGNHLTYQGDMVRRGVLCTIDARQEQPESREFDFHPMHEVREQRAELVAAALTVLRAYRAAGRPGRVKPLGSFEDYGLIRGALQWLDRADPADTMQNARAQDPELEERGILFRLLLAHYAGVRGEGAPRFRVRDFSEGLCHQLAQHMLYRGLWSPRGAGQLLRRHQGRPFCGVALHHDVTRSKESWWWFEIEPTAWEADSGHPWWHQQERPEPF
jgi:hypothetical protein